MKNLLVFLFLLAALFGWGMYIHQVQLQRGAELRIEAAILKQMDERIQQKESVDNIVESRKEVRLLLSQQDNKREIEDSLSYKWEQYENEYLEFQKRLEASIENKLSFYQQKQDTFEKQIAALEFSLESFNKNLSEFKKESEAFKKHSLEFEKEFRASFKDKQPNLENKIIELEKSLDNLRKVIAELESNISSGKAQASPEISQP